MAAARHHLNKRPGALKRLGVCLCGDEGAYRPRPSALELGLLQLHP